jgi:hypothetical protein
MMILLLFLILLLQEDPYDGCFHSNPNYWDSFVMLQQIPVKSALAYAMGIIVIFVKSALLLLWRSFASFSSSLFFPFLVEDGLSLDGFLDNGLPRLLSCLPSCLFLLPSSSGSWIPFAASSDALALSSLLLSGGWEDPRVLATELALDFFSDRGP